MLRKLTLLSVIVFVAYNLLPAQLNVKILSVPENTPEDATLFIAGNFNDWNPEEYPLDRLEDGTFQVSISPDAGEIMFKLSRGDWEMAEADNDGNIQANHIIHYEGEPMEYEMPIMKWADMESGFISNHENNVFVIDDFEMPELDRTRRIWIYLPPDYSTTTKDYPVIYMHDGQTMLCTNTMTSAAGEWLVDETLNEYFNNGDTGAIVIGVESEGSVRIDEYSPWINGNYGGGEGDKHAEFIVNTLKPYIDSNFRTLPDRKNTVVGGSSLAAYQSIYTAIRYQDVFSKAIVFSPSFWFNQEIYDYIESIGKQSDMRIYMMAGELEGAAMIYNMETMYDHLLEIGFTTEEVTVLKHEDGSHANWFWAREFPNAYEWIFREEVETSTENLVEDISLQFSPNPAKNSFYILSDQVYSNASVSIYSINGKLMHQSTVHNREVLLDGMPNGLYVIKIFDDEKGIKVGKLMISQ